MTNKNAKSMPKQAINILYTAEEMQKITEAAQRRGLTRTAYVKLRSLNQRTPRYISQLQQQIYKNTAYLNEKIQETQLLVTQLRAQTLDTNSQPELHLKEIYSQLEQAIKMTQEIQHQTISLKSKPTTAALTCTKANKRITYNPRS